MGNKYKLLEAAKQSNKNFKFTDLIKLAEYHGFVHVRQKGSHFMMKHDSKPLFMNFQNKKGQAKPFQVRQLLQAIEEYNL